jgi:hypothetical protein
MAESLLVGCQFGELVVPAWVGGSPLKTEFFEASFASFPNATFSPILPLPLHPTMQPSLAGIALWNITVAVFIFESDQMGKHVVPDLVANPHVFLIRTRGSFEIETLGPRETNLVETVNPVLAEPAFAPPTALVIDPTAE